MAVLVEGAARFLGLVPYSTEEVAIGTPIHSANITLRRTPIHPFLAEYQREISISFNDSEKHRVVLFPDTGGTVRIGVYKAEPDILTLIDRMSIYAIRVMEGGVVEFRCDDPNARASIARADYVGSFNWVGQGSSRTFRFISVEEGGELPLDALRCD